MRQRNNLSLPKPPDSTYFFKGLPLVYLIYLYLMTYSLYLIFPYKYFAYITPDQRQKCKGLFQYL